MKSNQKLSDELCLHCIVHIAAIVNTLSERVYTTPNCLFKMNLFAVQAQTISSFGNFITDTDGGTVVCLHATILQKVHEGRLRSEYQGEVRCHREIIQLTPQDPLTGSWGWVGRWKDRNKKR